MTKITWFRFMSSGKSDRHSAAGYRDRERSFCLGEPMTRMPHVMPPLLLLVALVLALPALADYYDGLRDWDAGRHGEALVKWQESAMEGDARSMMALGRLFVQGRGAPQDYIEAHKWFNLAASYGMEEAIAERDALAEKMTPAQIAMAQERAASWRPATREVETDTSEAETGKSEAETGKSEAETGKSEADPGPPPERAIREAQSLLAALGYEAGPVDGVWNEATANAYQQFLIDVNQPPSDTLTPQGLRAMHAIAKRRGVGAKTETGPEKQAIQDSTTRGIEAETVSESEKQAPRDIVVRAAKAGDVDGLQKALAAGADVNAHDDKGWTALMHAADKGYVLLVELLLAGGVDVNIHRPDGLTALFIAAMRGHSEIIEALVEAGADPAKAISDETDVNARDAKGWTALMRMADKGSMLLVEPLLKAGANPNLRLADGATALFIAVVRGHTEIAVALVEAGADPEIKGPKGKTAVDVARMRRDSVLLAALGVREAGEVFRDCETCPEMVVIPAGSFMMGSPPGEEDRNDDEGPQHRVTIAEPFAVGKYEVTFAEWDVCNREGGCSQNPRDEGWGRGSRPVINVSWDDARAYVNWLTRKTGKSYRLLSESEWEYAARGGTQTRYSWGDDVGYNRANCNGCGSRWDSEMTAPVGSFSANEFGLYDMHGNVWEWTQDCWNGGSYTGAPKDGRAWKSGSCFVHYFRGGSWDYEPWFLRAAIRNRFTTGYRFSFIGFRVARTLD